MRTVFFVLALFALLTGDSSAAARSKSVIRQFKAAHPCPSTALPHGPCPGWIIDHIVPLCLGGADALNNLQWQTIADARTKDRSERAACRKNP